MKRNANPFEITKPAEHFSRLRFLLKKMFLKCHNKNTEVKNQENVSGYEMYRIIYELCICSPMTQTERVYELIIKEIFSFAVKIEKEIKTSPNIVSKYSGCWRGFFTFVSMLKTVGSYLSRTIVLHEKKSLFKIKLLSNDFLLIEPVPIEFSCMLVWREVVLRSLMCKEGGIVKQVFVELKTSREEDRDCFYCRDFIHSCLEGSYSWQDVSQDNQAHLQFYKKEFEESFLKESEEFYSVKMKFVLQNNKPEQIFNYIKKMIEREQRSQRFYLGTVRGNVLVESIERGLFAEKRPLCFYIQQTIKNNQEEQVLFVYSTLKETKEGHSLFVKEYSKHCKEIFFQIFKETKVNPIEAIIQKIQELKKQISFLFSLDKSILDAIEEAVKSTINCDKIKKHVEFAKTLAEYSHRKIKEAFFTEQEKSEFISLLQKSKEKEIFKKSYCLFLSSRLLYSPSFDQEKELINVFCNSYGSEYVIEMKRMCFDAEKRIVKCVLSSNGFPIDVLILTDGMWPVFKNNLFDCQIEKERKELEENYKIENKRRKIKWERELETVEVLVKGETEKVIEMTPGQFFLLSLFQQEDWIDRETFDRKSLFVSKGKKSMFSSGLLIEEKDKIWYNKDFICGNIDRI